MISFLGRLADSYRSAAISHLWSSTIFLLLMIAIAFLLRNRLTAAARCWLALIGILKFAIPSAVFAPLMARPPAQLQIPLRFIGAAFRISPPQPTAPAVWP